VHENEIVSGIEIDEDAVTGRDDALDPVNEV
jgi:hypothetical protein